MIHRLDTAQRFRICPVQNELGQAVLAHYGLNAHDPESWMILDQGQIHTDLDALAYLGKATGRWGHILRVVMLIPKPLRDWAYARVARHRYRLFGRGDMCALPDPQFQKRLMK